MLQDDLTLSLFDVSTRLGVSPSAIKKRVVQLNLPVQRGSRGKLMFDRDAFALLSQADELLKAGHGFEECRRRLGLEGPVKPSVTMFPAPVAPDPQAELAQTALPEELPTETALPLVAPSADHANDSVAHENEAPVEKTEALPAPLNETRDGPPVRFLAKGVRALRKGLTFTAGPKVAAGADKPSPISVAPVVDALGPLSTMEIEPLGLPEPAAALASTAELKSEVSPLRELPPPVFIQLGRKQKATQTPPDLVSRLDLALKMLEEKERHNQMLQSKLLVAYDEMTKLSATAAAFQERSLNLAHEVQKLQTEMKLIAGPELVPAFCLF
jgi:hypothetical protein